MPHIKGPRTKPRHIVMRELFKLGKTMAEIGEIYGISRQRVNQVLKRHFGVRRMEGGQTMRRLKTAHDIVAKQKAKADAVAARHFAKYGVSREFMDSICDLPRSNRGHPLVKFRDQRRNAIIRGIPFEMNFAEWWGVWADSGKWGQRGRGYGYGMGRYGDSGGYTVDNVYICTGAQNAKDSYIVHPAHERTAKRAATLAARA